MDNENYAKDNKRQIELIVLHKHHLEQLLERKISDAEVASDWLKNYAKKYHHKD